MAGSPLERIKSRKLVQWVLAYLAGAWVVYEATGTALEAWNIPVFLVRSVHILLLFGLFLTLVIAWYHGEKGRQRVSGPELLMIGALLLIAGGVLRFLNVPAEMALPAQRRGDARPGIAVLPCENFSPDPDDAYFASGIHEEILLKLSKISSILSIGRESVEWYRDNPSPIPEMAADLGVNFIGACSVRKDQSRGQIRLSFQLSDATGAQLWAQDYDENLSVRSLFEIQGNIALQVATALQAELTPDEQTRLELQPTESLEAYDYYLLGNQALNTGSESGIREALEYFTRALAVDRDFAEGHAGTAKAYASLGYFNILPPAETWPLAEEGAERALELNEDLAEAHATLARVRAWFEWDWEGAEGEFRRAIELNPSDAEVREWFALFLASIGKSEEAIQQSAQAVTLNPRSVLARFFQMSTLAYAGRIAEARTMAEAAVEEDPLEPVFYWWIAVCRSSEGEYERAIPALLTQIGLMGGDVSDELGFLGYLFGRNDQRNRAMEALEQMNDRVREGVYVSPVAFAWVHIGLDDYEEAMAWLSRGFDSKANWMLTLKFHPLFESIREEPDFVELEKRMGLRSE